MGTLLKYISTILFVIAFASCSMIGDDYGTSEDYDLEYSIETSDAIINKIVYTDKSGETVLVNKINNSWNIKTSGKSGQTIKLEVFGENQNADIEMQIFAKNAKNTIERNIVKEKKANNFHYHIIHILE